MQHRDKAYWYGAPVTYILESAHRTHKRNIESIFFIGLPATLTVKDAGMKQAFQCIFGHNDIGLIIGIIRKLFGRHAALPGPEAVCFKEMGMGQKLNIHKVEP